MGLRTFPVRWDPSPAPPAEPVVTTVDRVLPWRRHSPPPTGEVAPLVALYRRKHPKAPTALISAAYERAESCHRGQGRQTGEPYITHPVAVATVVAELGLDDVSVAAALLHDAVEDTALSLAELDVEF